MKDTSKHTAGDWIVPRWTPEQDQVWADAGDHQTQVATCARSFGSDKANAARIVACVNACEGLNPAAVPALVASLRFMVDAAKTEPGMAIYIAHIEEAEKILDKAQN